MDNYKIRSFCLAFLILAVFSSALYAGPELSPEEKKWLKENGDNIILLYNTEFPPIEFESREGEFIGLGADIIAETEKILDIRFIKIPSHDWNDHLAKLKSGECAVAPTIVSTKERQEYSFFTNPYAVAPVVIITNKSLKGDLELSGMGGLKIAVVGGFATETYIRAIADNRFDIHTVSNVHEGLRMVSFNEVDAFIENLAVAAYYIELEGIPNLRVAGSTDYSFAWSIGISREYPLLYSAVQKAFDNIPGDRLKAIRNKWIKLDIGQGISPETLRLIYTIAVFSFILLISLAVVSYILKLKLAEKVAKLKKAQQEILRHAEVLKLATENTQAIVWDYYAGGERTLINQKDFSVHNIQNKERQMSMGDVFSNVYPEDMPRVKKALADYGDSDGSHVYEIEYRQCLPGSPCYWHLSKGKAIEWDDKGRPVRIVGVDINIQGIKEVQEKTELSEARFRAIFENAPYPIMINSLQDLSYIDANSTFLDNQGISKEDLAQLKITDFIPDFENIMGEFLDRVLKEGLVLNREVRVLRNDNTMGTAFLSSILVEIHGQRQILSMIVDVTKEKQAIEALQISEGKLRSAFSAMTDMIIVLDRHGNYIEIAPTNAEPLYMPPDEVLGKSIREVFPGDTSDRVIEAVRRALSENRPAFLEYDITVEDKRFWFISSISPLTADSVIWVSRDITNRKTAEIEREKLQDRLLQRQKLEAVGILAGGIAHDFNNMIGAIIGHAELAINALEKESPVIRNLDRILYAAERSANLTQQLLAFARKQAITPVIFDLNESIENILKMIRRLIGEDIELSWLPGSGSCHVCMDPSQFDQILINLCVNARDAIKGTGNISIETEAVSFDEKYCRIHADVSPGRYVMLMVSDNGCGIREEDLVHIFEPFFTTKGVGQGTGMGLATVYGIVKQNEGFITVESRPGKGTAFNIYIPRAKKDAESAGESSREYIPRSRGETVLVVEDDPTFLEFVILMLKELDYTVMSAKNPDDAIKILEHDKFCGIDMVITDIVMPGMSGKDMVERIIRILPGARYLFMSGYTADVIAHKGVLEKGINFIPKPFSLHQLAIKIREILDEEV